MNQPPWPPHRPQGSPASPGAGAGPTPQDPRGWQAGTPNPQQPHQQGSGGPWGPAPQSPEQAPQQRSGGPWGPAPPNPGGPWGNAPAGPGGPWGPSPQNPHPPQGQPRAYVPRAANEDPKTMAIFAHLGAFVAPVLLACLIFATTKDSTVKKAAAQALGFQLLSAVSFVAAMMLPVVGLVLLGLSNPRSMGERTAMLVGVLPILGTGIVAVLSIWGAIAAALRIHRGETWRMPVFGGLIETITRTRD